MLQLPNSSSQPNLIIVNSNAHTQDAYKLWSIRAGWKPFIFSHDDLIRGPMQPNEVIEKIGPAALLYDLNQATRYDWAIYHSLIGGIDEEQTQVVMTINNLNDFLRGARFPVIGLVIEKPVEPWQVIEIFNSEYKPAPTEEQRELQLAGSSNSHSKERQ